MKPSKSDSESEANRFSMNESSSPSVSSVELQTKSSCDPSKLFVIPHFRKEAVIISAGMSFYACEIHEQISSSEGFFCCPEAVNLWRPSAIHCIHFFWTPSLNGLFKDASSGWRNEVNPPGKNSKFSVLTFKRRFHGICHVGFKRVKYMQASSPPQATKPQTPCLFDPNFHLLWIRNSILLVSLSADFNGLLPSVVYRTVWQHVII